MEKNLNTPRQRSGVDVAEATLALTGDDLDPELVSRLIGVMPSRAWAKGEEYPSRSGQVLKKYSGLWALTIEDRGVQDAASRLLEIVEPKMREIRGAAEQTGSLITLSIWWDPVAGQGGFTTSSNIMKRLAEISERMDFYFPG